MANRSEDPLHGDPIIKRNADRQKAILEILQGKHSDHYSPYLLKGDTSIARSTQSLGYVGLFPADEAGRSFLPLIASTTVPIRDLQDVWKKINSVNLPDQILKQERKFLQGLSPEQMEQIQGQFPIISHRLYQSNLPLTTFFFDNSPQELNLAFLSVHNGTTPSNALNLLQRIAQVNLGLPPNGPISEVR